MCYILLSQNRVNWQALASRTWFQQPTARDRTLGDEPGARGCELQASKRSRKTGVGRKSFLGGSSRRTTENVHGESTTKMVVAAFTADKDVPEAASTTDEDVAERLHPRRTRSWLRLCPQQTRVDEAASTADEVVAKAASTAIEGVAEVASTATSSWPRLRPRRTSSWLRLRP